MKQAILIAAHLHLTNKTPDNGEVTVLVCWILKVQENDAGNILGCEAQGLSNFLAQHPL